MNATEINQVNEVNPANEVANENPVGEVKRIARVSNMPRREADLITVASSAVVAWRKKETLTLDWTTVDTFDTVVDAFRDSYRAGSSGKGARRSITRDFVVVNAEINNALHYVKGYIVEKFGKERAVANYAQFGIVKLRRAYMMPTDGDRRQESLEMMLAALQQHGMTTQKYGYDYWNDLYIRFGQAKVEAAAIDSAISLEVANKSEQMSYIRETLNALIYLIKANFPRTWKEELRRWGFQKEKY
jgi:hypothetical protein